MAEILQVIMKRNRCPYFGCWHKRTVVQASIVDDVKAGKYPADATHAIEHKITPLDQPALAVTSIRIIHSYIDYCEKCGRPYCTLAQVERMPVTAQMPNQPQGRGGGFPFNRG